MKTPARRVALLLEELKEAARVYAAESSGGGENPLLAGARLRLAAKAWWAAESAAQETRTGRMLTGVRRRTTMNGHAEGAADES